MLPPPRAAPARRPTTMSAPSALAAPSYAVAPAILSVPSLSSLPSLASLSRSPPPPLHPLPVPRHPRHPLPTRSLLPRNLRRCTRRPPLPITTARARARYLRQLTSHTCLVSGSSVNCFSMQLHRAPCMARRRRRAPARDRLVDRSVGVPRLGSTRMEERSRAE